MAVLVYPTMQECHEEYAVVAALPDVLAITECFPKQLVRTSQPPKVGL